MSNIFNKKIVNVPKWEQSKNALFLFRIKCFHSETKKRLIKVINTNDILFLKEKIYAHFL